MGHKLILYDNANSYNNQTLYFLILTLTALVVATMLLWLGHNLVYASTMLHGPVFVPSRKEDIQQMIKLAKIKKGERVIDLGSGDGAILSALAEQKIKAQGIEINPFLVRRTRKLIDDQSYSRYITVQRGNFWHLDLAKYDVIFLYGTSYIMKKLEKKLAQEMKPTARLVSNYFALPNWPVTKKIGKINLYQNQSRS